MLEVTITDTELFDDSELGSAFQIRPDLYRFLNEVFTSPFDGPVEVDGIETIPNI